MNNLVTDLADWGLNVAFWASVAFFWFTTTVWPWWKSAWGLNIILLDFAISLALLPSIASHDFGFHTATSSVALWIEVAALWLVGIIVIWRGVMIVVEQSRGIRRSKSHFSQLSQTQPSETVVDERADT